MLMTAFSAFTACNVELAAGAIALYIMIFFIIKRASKMPTIVHAAR
jgi:hypothetical protein